MSGSSSLRVTATDDVLELRLERPERRNALDHATIDALLAAVRAHQHDVRAIVLTGGGRFFSAGGDVSSMPTAAQGLMGPSDRLSRIHDLLRTLRQAPAPSIAAVEGYAIGVAWGLALGCDLIVASHDAFFSAPFSARGLAADGGVAWHLSRRLGRHAAGRHLLLGERMTAAAALEHGLVSSLVEPGSATDHAHQVARDLAAGPMESAAVTRWMCDVAEASDMPTFLREERVGVALAGHGADAAEGHAAFAGRRPAVFAR